MSSSPFTGHELRQFAGEPDTISKTADQYKTLGDAMKTTADTLRDIGESQISKGTDKLKSDAESIESDLRQAGVRYAGTGAALTPYATALETARTWYTAHHQEVENAENNYQTAYAKHQSTLFSPGPTDDNGDSDVTTTAKTLENASDDRDTQWRAYDSVYSTWKTAFDTAADGVADAMDQADNDDSFWDKIAFALEILGYVLVVIAVVALFVVASPWAEILLATTIALSALHLAGTVYLYANGKASLSDVLWSAFGLVTAGAGAIAGRVVAAGAKAGPEVLAASKAASKLPVFAKDVRTFSMPTLGGFVNPFSTLARGSEFASLSRWGTDLAEWTARSGPRSATIASAWADVVLESVPKLGGAGVTAVTSWIAGVAGGIYSSPRDPFYVSFGRP